MFDIESRSVRGLLALTAVRGIGPVLAERLASRFPRLQDLVEGDIRSLSKIVPTSIFEIISSSVEIQKAVGRADAILNEAERRNVRILSVFDEIYPKRLKAIPDRPSLLYVKGRLSQSGRDVACIGTREPSRFGEEVTRRLVAQLVSADWTIVSGLAIGIDTISHNAAIEHCGPIGSMMQVSWNRSSS
jgi:DNA processing protein